MQSVDLAAVDTLEKILQNMKDRFPEARREYHERCAARLKEEITQEISARTKTSGRLAGWQKETVGSGGGYAAIRPDGATSGANSPGAITNYVENGHAVAVGPRADRKPTTRKYVSRVKVGVVKGRHFYQAVRSRALRIAMEEAETLVKDIMEAADAQR